MTAVLVDTSIWSLAFRRKKGVTPEKVELLRELIEQGTSVCVTGVIVQELLSGVRDLGHFEDLMDKMRGFFVVDPTFETHIEAARLANICRLKGITATTIDLLIAAICIEHDLYLLTSDLDFEHIKKVCSLKLVN